MKLVTGLATDILGSVVEVDEVEEQQADRPAPGGGSTGAEADPSEVMQVRLVNALEAKDWPF